ncbi:MULTISPECIES: DUF6215 domain-containing protein [unclassified Streptomyces]|uniref:DUF6215 domain-containing protein n=1 Tax=unclassified Streptomyces TaxID=2593676 RepID=UPI000DC4CB97|nr:MULTISPECIES: DUF6215 domain-containing protein [unclassified Streptomyces]MYT72210.1 hypothetical protein [Streptomyces sp. SID8367]RAJ81623.1 hypothetical protein K377_04641 [Streptomyces sp. PsTaAH-137]
MTEKPVNVWGQAVAAFALVGALGVGFWALAQQPEDGRSAAEDAATCSGGAATKKDGAAGRVSGAQLCKALNQRGLADWLGIPGERPTSASGNGGSVEFGKRKIPTPSARVEFETYTVELTASYDDYRVDQDTAAFIGRDVHRQKVLRRPAVFYTTQTMGISFRLDGSDAKSTEGVPAEALSVALDAKNRGGSYELVMWRNHGGYPDRTILLDIAEHVLPVVPGFGSGSAKPQDTPSS